MLTPSMASNLLSLARDLQRRKARERRGATIIEGVRLLEEALSADVVFRGVLVTETFGDGSREADLLQALADRTVSIEDVSGRELGEVADTHTPQGIVAVIDVADGVLADMVPTERAPVLVLDAVQDPGNVGALIRTAWALGCRGAVALDGTADMHNPKVVRAAMGATFRFPAAAATAGEFASWIEQHHIDVWVTDTDGDDIASMQPPARLAVVVGNEGAGAREELETLATSRVGIPLSQGVESLNVVVAAGIVLYEVANA